MDVFVEITGQKVNVFVGLNCCILSYCLAWTLNLLSSQFPRPTFQVRRRTCLLAFQVRRRTCLDRTRLTSVSSASCLTAPPNSSASHASLLKQNPLGCEHIEEKRWSLQQRIRLVRCWRAFYLFADVFPPGSVHWGAVKRIIWKENNFNPRGLAGRRIIVIQKKNIR